MKVVAISDTHCQLEKVIIPDGDLLIHSGDLTYRGNLPEISKELILLKEKGKNFKKIVLICGNHDWLGEKNPSLMRQLCEDNGIEYLDHSSIEFEGFKIFGSAYTPEFFNWAFNVPRGEELKEKWALIPDDTNILVTHGPPYGVRDWVQKFDQYTGKVGVEIVGCQDLSDRIAQLKQLKTHVFGHLHDGYGTSVINGVTYVNAATCNERYDPVNKAIELEI